MRATTAVWCVVAAVVLTGHGVAWAAESEAAVEVSVGAGVQMEASSLSAIYGRAEHEHSHDSARDGHADEVLVPTGSKLLNMAKSVDATIKSSAQEEWGCCRVCDDMDEMVQKIPPALEPEYGHSIRDQRRHVAPERGFQDFMPPMVSCCPICLWPPKTNPEAKRVPTFRGDMETEMSTFPRGDGPTDAQVLEGAADEHNEERVKEFAAFDKPNYRPPAPEFVSGWREREAKRKASAQAHADLAYARKYLKPESIEAAEAAMADHVFAEVDGAAYTDAEGDAEDAEEDAEMMEADDAAEAAEGDAEDEEDMRFASSEADAEAGAETDAEKFRLGKALKKAGKFLKKGLKAGGRLLKKGLKAGARLLKKAKKFGKKFGGQLQAMGGVDAFKQGLASVAGAAQGALGQAGAALGGAASAFGGAMGGAPNTGAPMPPGGASIVPPGAAAAAASGAPAGGAPGGAPGGGMPPPPPAMTPEQQREAAEEAQRIRDQQLNGGVPNVRRTSAPMEAMVAPVKPWNPLQDLKGHNMHYSLVTDPELKFNEFGGGPLVKRQLSKSPTPYLPPCCNLCGVNSGPRLTQPDRYSTCCYYCVRKPYGERPPRQRLRESTRPLPKLHVTMESVMTDRAKASALPQADGADIFSPRPPLLHANRNRFHIDFEEPEDK